MPRISLDTPVIGMARDGTLICRDCRNGDTFNTNRTAASFPRPLTPLERHIVELA